ncbi:hypothetical protein [Blautia obeum]|uniref:hypothetical protein n=1 Tax=Blautia obeum TaxID=40520 RepID=UPI000A7EB767|nr:hypothetical protein [Blautia obeum]
MKNRVLFFYEAYPGGINDLDAYIKVELSRQFKTVAGRSYRGTSTVHSSSPAWAPRKKPDREKCL